MVSGPKTMSLETDQTAAAKAVEENGTSMGSGPQLAVESQHGSDRKVGLVVRKADVAQVALRLLCIATSVTALVFMVTAREAGTVSIYGFSLPVYSKWSFSDSFDCGGSLVAAIPDKHITPAEKGFKYYSPRNHAWLILAADQVFAYAMMSAGSAASAVGNLNRTGVKHSALPNFCKPLRIFCNHVAISIAFSFFSGLLLAISAVQDVIWLSKN